MSFATGTTRIFRLGLLAIAMLGFCIVLAFGNSSIAWAQSDDQSGDAAAVQPDQNGASDADPNDANAAAAQQATTTEATDPAQQAQAAADSAAEALDSATEARDQLESDGASQDQIDAANRAVAEARFNKDNADAAVKSADDAANQ